MVIEKVILNQSKKNKSNYATFPNKRKLKNLLSSKAAAKISFTLLMLLLTLSSWAQTFSGAPSFEPDVLDNPIDGGLSLLLGAGAVYGAKKIRDFRKNIKSNDNEK
jgi:hypothetical protein